ncbi:hypothetical protein [Mycobacterium avium]|uniref:hypothetical protein n=1 Tax=Mycobacterium avium TaxID=1764 RepID=UPI00116043FE|nr:hypothetical protein [Mycobacterium avium]
MKLGDGSLLADSFLSRNSWLSGVVVAVVLFLITTGLALHWRNRDKDSKHLDYQILSDTPIVTSRDRPEILKVIYGANKVSNPFITELRSKTLASSCRSRRSPCSFGDPAKRRNGFGHQ